MSSSTETRGLLGDTSSGEYQPVDAASAKIHHRRRWMKLGLVAGVAVAAIVGVVSLMHHPSSTSTSSVAVAAVPAATQVDRLFAGLLFDEKAFYFPMESTSVEDKQDPATRRRFLRALAAKDAKPAAAPWETTDWSYGWNKKDSKKDFAAIGEYYRAKGLSLSDYYRSKYDPTYASGTPGSPASTKAPWTADWQADKERGIAMGQKYAAIGQEIADHYRAAFDPTYKSAEDNSRRRVLKSKDAKNADDEVSGYDWQADRDRGIAIGQHFKELGEEIKAHYSAPYTGKDDGGGKWREYKEQGLAIARHYKQKADAIQGFYAGKLKMEGMAPPQESTLEDPRVDVSQSASETKSKSSDPKDDSYVWGLDYQQDKKHALSIHKDWMDKGKTIGNYYRSVYDPTYGATKEDDKAKSTKKAADHTSDDRSPAIDVPRNPDLDFPPWGQDPEADRAHGKALGEYWAQKGKAIGKYWAQKGPELHTYYEDKYRTMFDPTYVKPQKQP